MHRLSEVTIRNFKSVKDLTLQLNDYTPLIGQNNVGKSNVLEAIEWFLGNHGLDEGDFNDINKEIEVIGKIEGIDKSIFTSLDEKHQKQIEKYITDERIIFKKVQLKASGRKGDRELLVKTPNNSDGEESKFRKAPTGLPEALDELFPDCIFINAMQDATKDISQNQRNTTIGQLISSLSGKILEENKEEINQSLTILENLFGAESSNRAKQLEKFDQKAEQVTSDFFPGISLKLHIPPPTLDDILKNGTVQVYEDDEKGEELRDFNSLGHGAQRTIQMAMIRLLANMNSSSSNSSRKFLIIEEPELYLHPKAIHRLSDALKSLSNHNFQIIFATHSPIIISKDDIPDTIILKKDYVTGTYKLDSMRNLVNSKITENHKQADILFDLTNSSKILFSDKIVLLEGKTDKITIPFLYHRISSKEKRNASIEFIPMNGGGGIPKARQILSAMDIKVYSLVDLDFCFKEAEEKNLLENENSDLKMCKDILINICRENDIDLDEDKLPVNSGKSTAAEAYEMLGENKEAEKHLENLQNELANKGYWLWRLGDLETILGLESKKDAKPFVNTINRGKAWEEHTANPEEVEKFVEWIDQ